MGGCLIRIILLVIVTVFIIFVASNFSDPIKDRVDKVKNIGTIISKIIRYKNND